MFQDLRYGVRMLLKHKGFTVVTVLTLAIGIGANTAIFSVINAVLLRLLPYRETDRLVMVWVSNPARGENRVGASEPDFVDFRKQAGALESLAAFTQFRPALTGSGQAEKICGALVTPDFFSVLGVQPALGRNFSAADAEPGQRTVILSHGLWQQRFGADPGLIGQPIQLNHIAHTVIGVLPAGFHPLSEDKDLYRPMKFDKVAGDRGYRILPMIGRLKEGVTIQQAQAEMSAIASRLERQYPETNSGYGVRLISLDEQVTGDVSQDAPVTRFNTMTQLLSGSVAQPRFRATLVGLFALAALAVVATGIYGVIASLVSQRTQEMCIRIALGAQPKDIFRLIITEGLKLIAAGILLGLLGSLALTRFLSGLLFGISPTDSPTFVAISVLLAAVALLACYLPARRATKVDAVAALRHQ